MSTDTLDDVKVDVIPTTEDGDHDLFAHYVRKADLEKAIFDGVACTALCGKKWLPTRDFAKFPVCPDCKETWEKFLDE